MTGTPSSGGGAAQHRLNVLPDSRPSAMGILVPLLAPSSWKTCIESMRTDESMKGLLPDAPAAQFLVLGVWQPVTHEKSGAGFWMDTPSFSFRLGSKR